MATPRRLSSRALPAPWTRAAHNARTRQLFSMCARACVLGARGWTSASHPFTFRTGTQLRSLACPGPTSKQDTGVAQPLHSPVERGLDFHGSPFSMQSLHPDVGGTRRMELRTHMLWYNPLFSFFVFLSHFLNQMLNFCQGCGREP